MTGRYVGSDQWQEHVAKAIEHWHVIAQLQDGKAGPHGMAAEFSDDWTTRFVEAEAKTGSRYQVVATRLGGARIHTGGPVLISVLQPWQAAYPLQEGGPLHSSYVAEHLTGGRGRWDPHGGDLAALTYTIAHVLGRKPVIG